MRNLITFIVLLLMFSACGVDTSSSGVPTDDSSEPVEDSTINDDYVINPNPITDGSNDDNSTDDNSTDGGTSGGGSDDDGFSQEDSYFDIEGAVYDQFACIVGNANDGYTDEVITDSGTDDRSVQDSEYGVSLTSYYSPAYVGGSEVSVFYYKLIPYLDGSSVNIIHDGLYALSINKAWADNDQKKVYVMTPANSNGYLSCYRYDLSTIDENTYTRTKVYREK